MQIRKIHTCAAFLIIVLSAVNFCSAVQKVAIYGIDDDPRVTFAIGDIKQALQENNYTIVKTGENVRIIFAIFEAGMGPQSFRIRREGTNTIRIVGGDSLGAMYGGLELAEMVSLGSSLKDVQEKARKPYIFRRGLKFNIPFDGRAPSYDDTGTAAQKNIPVMWEFDFWQEFLDTLARNRYNVLTLWTTHPYPGLVKLDKYPDIGYDDVCVIKETVSMKTDRHFDNLDIYDASHFKLVKKISLDE